MAEITWAERMQNLHTALGRAPTMDEMMACVEIHQMTDAEKEEQRQSWARSMAPCEHGRRDWEQCPDCRRGAERDPRA